MTTTALRWNGGEFKEQRLNILNKAEILAKQNMRVLVVLRTSAETASYSYKVPTMYEQNGKRHCEEHVSITAGRKTLPWLLN